MFSNCALIRIFVSKPGRGACLPDRFETNSGEGLGAEPPGLSTAGNAVHCEPGKAE